MITNSRSAKKSTGISSFNRELITLLISGFVILGAVPFGFAARSVTPTEQASFFALETPEEVRTRLITQTIVWYNPRLSGQQKTAICDTIIAEAAANKFDPFFISGVIAAESNFHPRAVSRCEALGLMQITAGVIEVMGINNPFDIQENIYAGTRYLKDLRCIFGESELILAAYNAGPTRVARLGRIPRIEETVHYVRRVTDNYRNLQRQFRMALHRMSIKPSYPDVFCSVTHRKQFASNLQTGDAPTGTGKPNLLKLTVIDLDDSTYKFVIRPQSSGCLYPGLKKMPLHRSLKGNGFWRYRTLKGLIELA